MTILAFFYTLFTFIGSQLDKKDRLAIHYGKGILDLYLG